MFTIHRKTNIYITIAVYNDNMCSALNLWSTDRSNFYVKYLRSTDLHVDHCNHAYLGDSKYNCLFYKITIITPSS